MNVLSLIIPVSFVFLLLTTLGEVGWRPRPSTQASA
jgi:hypothetical protein